MKYIVDVKCGHVGKNNYIIKSIPISADSSTEAAELARWKPRVKHDHPDAIRQVRVVDAARFAEFLNVYKDDPYFKCRSIQEQKRLCPDLEVFREERWDRDEDSRESCSIRPCYDGKLRIRNPKKYIRYCYNDYGFSEDIAA